MKEYENNIIIHGLITCTEYACIYIKEHNYYEGKAPYSRGIKHII